MSQDASLLVVDDTPESLRMITELLQSQGYKVRPADSGALALASVRALLPELILLDVRMPGIDGFEVCRQLKADALTQDIPIIFLSASAETAERVEGFGLGAVDFVAKPFQRDELLARVRTHLELARLRRRLEAFVYSVSHDLMAPVRAVGGFAALLERAAGDQLTGDSRRYLGNISRSAVRMQQLIDDLLRLSRMQRTTLRLGAVDLGTIAEQVIADLRAHEPERRVEVVIEPGLTAQADEGLVRLLLTNLLGNAWKFSARRDPARIEVGRAGGPGAARFFVRDNGVGFQSGDAAKLFQPFSRLHADREFLGTGLGLTIVARVIERHRGTIVVEARPDEGATFTFTLAPAGAAPAGG